MMKNKIILILSISFLWISCTTEKQNNINAPSHDNQLVLSAGLNELVDSFIVVLQEKKKTIPVLGYIKLIESRENKIFKIYFSTVDNDSLFNFMTIDDYFIKDGFVFCVDYNKSNIVKQKNENVAKVKKLIKLKDQMYPNPGTTRWLVQLNNDTIQRINKKALSFYGPKCLNCLEWGGYTD